MTGTSAFLHLPHAAYPVKQAHIFTDKLGKAKILSERVRMIAVVLSLPSLCSPFARNDGYEYTTESVADYVRVDNSTSSSTCSTGLQVYLVRGINRLYNKVPVIDYVDSSNRYYFVARTILVDTSTTVLLYSSRP